MLEDDRPCGPTVVLSKTFGAACSLVLVFGLVLHVSNSGKAVPTELHVLQGQAVSSQTPFYLPQASQRPHMIQKASTLPSSTITLKQSQVRTPFYKANQSTVLQVSCGIVAPLVFVVLFLWRKPSAKAQPSLVLFSSSEDGEPEPQKKAPNHKRWEDMPSHPSTTRSAEESKTFRTAVVQWLMSYKKAAFGDTATATQTQKAEAPGLDKLADGKAEQKEYLVMTPFKTWDPTIVSDPVAAARQVTADELENDKLLALLLQKRDEELNILAWKCLGYQYIAIGSGYAWDTSRVFPKWRARYPIPPDLVGICGYTPETIEAVEFLVKTTAEEYHDALERYAKSLGLRYSAKHVTPSAMRKAQVTQWLMYYREELFGLPMEELLRRKQEQAQESKKQLMKVLQQRANALGVTLEEVLEREERKKKRQRMEKIRDRREREELLRSPLLP